MTETVCSRSSRNRRVVALMGWAGLVVTAVFLWNARQTGSVRTASAEPLAFVLAAFSAFVGVFAWMLFNPGRRSAAESPSLFFAAAATLFPPPIIGFCLMPIDSPLRGWLAMGLFLLCVIAILSHVPDEFFGVPRGRHTYLTPIPAFDRVEDTVLDPNASWFRFEDLSHIVSDRERPSLAPRAYLQRDTPRVSPAARPEMRPVSPVDDILGTEFDLGLLDDSPIDDAPSQRSRPAPPYSGRQTSRPATSTQRRRDQIDQPHTVEADSLRAGQQTAEEQGRRLTAPRTLNQQVGHAESTRVAPAGDQGLTSRYVAGTAAESVISSPQPPSSLHRTADSSTTSDTERKSYRRREQRRREQSRHEQRRRETEPELREETVRQRVNDITTVPEPFGRTSDSVPRVIPVPFGPVAPAQGFLESPRPTAQPLVDTTVQRGRMETRETSRTETESGARQSRYDNTHRNDSRQPQIEQRTTPTESGSTAAPTRQQNAFQRTTDEAGSELVEGVMKVHFDSGQKRTNIHIPFSPPLAGMPEVECECVGDESLRLKVPVRQSYGIRIEARRSNADQPLDADIGFAAVYTAE